MKDEIVLSEGRCSYRKSCSDPFDWAVGSVVLDKRHLTFWPNCLNLGKGERSIRLEDILSVQAKQHGSISNKIAVLLKDGSAQEFKVSQKAEWLRALEMTVNNKNKHYREPWSIGRNISLAVRLPKIFVKTTCHVLILALWVSMSVFFLHILMP